VNRACLVLAPILLLTLAPLLASDKRKLVEPVSPCRLDVPLRAGAERLASTLNTIVLHHTALPSFGDSVYVLRQRGLSYHYLIDPEGRVIQGVPVRRIAMHAAGANRTSIGVSLVGGSDTLWVPSLAQLSATKQLLGDLLRAYPRIRFVMGHGDVRDTNQGEPYGVVFPRLVEELRTEQGLRLTYPGFDEEPLRTFREAALKLLERPPASRPATRPRPVRPIETVTCNDGVKISYAVPMAMPKP
jgi:hypothetical protein